MAPVSDFQGLFSNYPATFTAQCHWYFYAPRYTLFRAVFLGFWCFRDPPHHPIFELNWEPYISLASGKDWGWGGDILPDYNNICEPELGGGGGPHCLGGGGGLIHVHLEGGGGPTTHTTQR